MNIDFSRLEEIINYKFRDPVLLKTALTHSSYSNERHKGHDYERLEFLGDAVLELVSSDHLYRTHPEMLEGDMTKLRAAMVCEPALAACARKIGLQNFILLGRGENQGGGRTRDSIVADVCEAVIGSIYLDGGFECARQFVMDVVISGNENVSYFSDAKSELQIRAQAEGKTVTYEAVSETGPDHAKIFEENCLINGRVVSAGHGKTRKSAQQDAAAAALRSVYVS